MRTAEDYISKNMILFDCDELIRLNIVNLINRARKEAIEECAKKFPSSIRNRESILSLIDELK